MTTLEWLLIVAAVAGLAALAVVLVQNVVDETAEEISGSNARITAAEVAAVRITSDARAELPSSTAVISGNKWKDVAEIQGDVNEEYSSKCNRLEITYSDASVQTKWWEADPATSASVRGTTSDESSKSTGAISEANDDSDPKKPKKALCEIKA